MEQDKAKTVSHWKTVLGFGTFHALLALLSPSLLRSRVRNFGLVLDGDGVNRRSPEGSQGFL
jgi:hypothetical protein